MVVFDASFLLLLIQPNAKPPNDPATKKPVENCQSRIEYLISELNSQRTPVVVPAPALSEFLVRAGRAATSYLQQLQNAKAIKIEPFGERAAIECALLVEASKRKKRKAGETWAKVKFDRQILAIAKVVDASTIYTTDISLAKLTKLNGITPCNVYELPLPPVEQQTQLQFKDDDDSEESGEG
jgi:predicted nucleic acid-binding protein